MQIDRDPFPPSLLLLLLLSNVSRGTASKKGSESRERGKERRGKETKAR